MIPSESRIRNFRSQPRNLRGAVTMKLDDKHAGNESLVGKSQQYLGEKHGANEKPVTNGRGEDSVKEESNGKCDTARKSLNRYSWQEIQRHNQKDDQWLVIHRKVYDVTGWAKRHPGGHRVLNHYAGEDATDVFRAMHLKLDTVKLYLNPLLIGELAPEEPSQERNKNVSELVEDFQELRRTLEAMNMFKANWVFFFLHLAHILILETLAWLIVWHFGNGWLVTIFISFLLTISQMQSAFLQHDAGHCSMFTNPKWNHLMQKFLMSHLKGLSTKWWNHEHFQHHVKTNIYPKDPDINVGPLFLVGDIQPVKYGKKKIKYIDYEKQHLYFYLGESPWSHFLYHPLSLKQAIVKADGMTAVLSQSHQPIPHFLLLFSERFLESPWMIYIVQMSHIPMKMSTEEEKKDWFSTQVLATCNIEQSFFNDWFTGHQNFQIEHHLFPTMPRHNYHKVAPLVRSLCAKHGLLYVTKPPLEAFGDIVR
uniref:Cytochrome b5 heme-binding domain-containing protein n=1 Tax=Ursus americanus TaxID=9643 RepID=A0A452RF66_URSAM